MVSVADAPRLITAAEMDQMTPDQRAAVVNERVVTRLDDLPDEFRHKVLDTARRLAEQYGLSNTPG